MCDIINVDDKESYEVALAENLQQKSMNPIEEARAFQKYVHNFGWGAESDLAKKIGKSPEYISRRIKLLELPKDIQDRIIYRKINARLFY